MKVQWIKISNYRQFVDEEAVIAFDEKLTVVAGANNSGKTSIMELIRNVLGKEKVHFKTEDVPVKNIVSWIQEVQPVFEYVFSDNTTDEENFSTRVLDKFIVRNEFEEEHIRKEYCLPELKIKICVVYDKETDDIQKYAECLMDLDSQKNHFFFQCGLEWSENKYKLALKKNYSRLKRRYDALKHEKKNGEKNTKDRESSFQKIILETYFDALEANCYFCDERYQLFEKLEWDQFKELFNIQYISASRVLDDESKDKTRTLSREMVAVIEKSTENWNEIMKELPDEIIATIENTSAKDMVRKGSLDGLKTTIEEIVSTNGGHAATPGLQIDMEEPDVKVLLSHAIAAKYEVQQYSLNESSQGLGLSNLVYIHLQLQKFKNSYDTQKTNLFLLEEPEAHMHPQMQQVFIKYLLELKLEDGRELQGIMSTHAVEMVGSAGFSILRVVREKEAFVSKVVDLSGLDNRDGLYDWFFQVGYSDIVFADKAILYEGDTECFYLRKLIQSKEHIALKGQYIAYIQVGGAYAFRYQELLDLLEIKTLIITDIDYAKDVIDEQMIKDSKTTNATLKNYYNLSEGKKDPKVEELYEWKTKGKNIRGSIYLAYQTEEDGYARTLEEAMLCKLEAMKVSEKRTKQEWEILKKRKGLDFALPNKISTFHEDENKEIVEQRVTTTDETKISVRDILMASAGKKTDFMYSVLMNGYEECMQPEYIRKGLEWLKE